MQLLARLTVRLTQEIFAQVGLERLRLSVARDQTAAALLGVPLQVQGQITQAQAAAVAEQSRAELIRARAVARADTSTRS